MTAPAASAFDTFGDAIEFIFSGRESELAGRPVGGFEASMDLLLTQTWICIMALALAVVLALPVGAWLGHRGTGEFLAVAIGNAGRAIPELAIIAIMVAFIGTGTLNVTIAVMILGIPPILTNAFVGMRQVDRGAVEAARGIGMTEWEIIRKVELPLAVPTIMGGVRTASINVIATATIGSIAGVNTLGDFIFSSALYGDAGLIAGSILVALLALTGEVLLAGLQRVLTPRGLELQRRTAAATA